MKKYKYNGEILTAEELVNKLVDEKMYLKTATITCYYLGSDYIGNDDDLSNEDIINCYMDGNYDCGAIEVEE